MFETMPLAFVFFLVLFVLVAGFIGVVIVGAIVSGVRTWKRNSAAPLERTEALVVTKRTHVSGGGGESSASTWYYVTFERLNSRAREEFRVDAATYGVLAEGDLGLLAWQGSWFKGFERKEGAQARVEFCGACGSRLPGEGQPCAGCGARTRVAD